MQPGPDLSKAHKLNFYRERKPSIQTVSRWIKKGVKAIDGRYVQLEALQIGREWYSTQTAVDTLILALNTLADTVPQISPATRYSQNDAAKKVLEAAGI